jgi:hypothetical protein
VLLRTSATSAGCDAYIVEHWTDGAAKGIGWRISKRVGGTVTVLQNVTSYRTYSDWGTFWPADNSQVLKVAIRCVVIGSNVLVCAKHWQSGGSEPAWPADSYTGYPSSDVAQALDNTSTATLYYDNSTPGGIAIGWNYVGVTMTSGDVTSLTYDNLVIRDLTEAGALKVCTQTRIPVSSTKRVVQGVPRVRVYSKLSATPIRVVGRNVSVRVGSRINAVNAPVIRAAAQIVVRSIARATGQRVAVGNARVSVGGSLRTQPKLVAVRTALIRVASRIRVRLVRLPLEFSSDRAGKQFEALDVQQDWTSEGARKDWSSSDVV